MQTENRCNKRRIDGRLVAMISIMPRHRPNRAYDVVEKELYRSGKEWKRKDGTPYGNIHALRHALAIES